MLRHTLMMKNESPKTYATIANSWDVASGYLTRTNSNLTIATNAAAFNNGSHNAKPTIIPTSGIWSVEVTIVEIVFNSAAGVFVGLSDQEPATSLNLHISTRQGATIALAPGASTDFGYFNGSVWTGGGTVTTPVNGATYLIVFDLTNRRVGAVNSSGTFTWTGQSAGTNTLKPYFTVSKTTSVSPYYQKITVNFGATAFSSTNKTILASSAVLDSIAINSGITVANEGIWTY